MLRFINIFSITMLFICGISCDRDQESYSEEFFYGVWNQSENNPQNFAFYYTQGFDFQKDGVCYPRYDYEGEGSFVTNEENIGSWNYSDTKSEITFIEDDSKFPKI